MGWNSIEIVKTHPVLEGINGGSYFVHSSSPTEEEGVISTTTPYGVEFASSVQKGMCLLVNFILKKVMAGSACGCLKILFDCRKVGLDAKKDRHPFLLFLHKATDTSE